jgi:hypothetical protein
MAGAGGDRERLREKRIAAERRQAAEARRREILGYVVAGVLASVVAVGIVVAIASGGGGGESAGAIGDCDNAAIDETAGTAEGLECDPRAGAEPPPLQQADLERAAEVAGCELRLELPEEGTEHVPESKRPTYETKPPTSGAMYEMPAADGAFVSAPPDPRIMHSLEHGRIAIQYSPALSEADQLVLKGVFDESPDFLIMFPNQRMPYEVAATAWTRLIGCESYNDRVPDALRAFRDVYRNQGPESM